MKHQTAIEILQDKIIYYKGQIVISKEMGLKESYENEMIRHWEKEIKKIKTAQEILKL